MNSSTVLPRPSKTSICSSKGLISFDFHGDPILGFCAAVKKSALYKAAVKRLAKPPRPDHKATRKRETERPIKARPIPQSREREEGDLCLSV